MKNFCSLSIKTNIAKPSKTLFPHLEKHALLRYPFLMRFVFIAIIITLFARNYGCCYKQAIVLYRVKSEQNLSQIAKRYNITAAALERANNLQNRANVKLSPGQLIKIPLQQKITVSLPPPASPVLTKPKKSLPLKQNAAVKCLPAALKAQLKENSPHLKKQELNALKEIKAFLAQKEKIQPAVYRPPATTMTRPIQLNVYQNKSLNKPLGTNSGYKSLQKAPFESKSYLMWPVKGQIITNFGPQPYGLYNDGINIKASHGTPVRAAENGVVAYVGNRIRSLGNLLLIKHNNKLVTVYAHLSRVQVKVGAKVIKGEIIANVGDTGTIRVSQLHFQVRLHNSQVINPLHYLPLSA